jgi:hypothetical protein
MDKMFEEKDLKTSLNSSASSSCPSNNEMPINIDVDGGNR